MARVPGGSSTAQLAGIGGLEGRKRVKAWVREGGGCVASAPEPSCCSHCSG
jgi:hypothetical protein